MTFRTHSISYLFIQAAVIAILILAGCSSDDAGNNAGQTTSPAADDTSDAELSQDTGDSANTVEIEIRSEGGRNFYAPVGVSVEPGTTIRFVNRSGRHTVTAYHPDNNRELRIPESADSFDSGSLGGDDTFEITLTEPGVYDYFCRPHEGMGHVGRIVVGDVTEEPGTSGLPNAAIDILPSVEDIRSAGSVSL